MHLESTFIDQDDLEMNIALLKPTNLFQDWNLTVKRYQMAALWLNKVYIYIVHLYVQCIELCLTYPHKK